MPRSEPVELVVLARLVTELQEAEELVGVLRARRRKAARLLQARTRWSDARITRELNRHLSRPVAHDTITRLLS